MGEVRRVRCERCLSGVTRTVPSAARGKTNNRFFNDALAQALYVGAARDTATCREGFGDTARRTCGNGRWWASPPRRGIEARAPEAVIEPAAPRSSAVRATRRVAERTTARRSPRAAPTRAAATLERRAETVPTKGRTADDPMIVCIAFVPTERARHLRVPGRRTLSHEV